jgi:hypothetical protein
VIIQQKKCDKCTKTVDPDDFVEWQEFMHWKNVGGYGSVFGDGVEVGVDLCQHCAKEVLGPYIGVISRYATPSSD